MGSHVYGQAHKRGGVSIQIRQRDLCRLSDFGSFGTIAENSKAAIHVRAENRAVSIRSASWILSPPGGHTGSSFLPTLDPGKNCRRLCAQLVQRRNGHYLRWSHPQNSDYVWPRCMQRAAFALTSNLLSVDGKSRNRKLTHHPALTRFTSQATQ